MFISFGLNQEGEESISPSNFVGQLPDIVVTCLSLSTQWIVYYLVVLGIVWDMSVVAVTLVVFG